jgi:predicted AlkP superfamily pyrophosphatase or phosphodiesterase
MREYDQLIEKIYKDAKNKNEKVNMFIFSDHGMEEIV